MNSIDKIVENYKTQFKRGDTGALRFADGVKVVNPIGVGTLIDQCHIEDKDESTSLGYSYNMEKKDYELLSTMKIERSHKKTNTSTISRTHDSVLSGIQTAAILNRCDYRCITFDEIPVGHSNLCVKKGGVIYTPIGSIDFICLNCKNEIVIGEVKTSVNYYKNYTPERLFLKEDYARQLHLYSVMLEAMGKEKDIHFKVVNFVILGIWDPKGDGIPEDFQPSMTLWKIHVNRDKWICAHSDKELQFSRIDFVTSINVKPEFYTKYKAIATLSESIVGDKNLTLFFTGSEREFKYILMDIDTQRVLKPFRTFDIAQSFIEKLDKQMIAAMYIPYIKEKEVAI